MSRDIEPDSQPGQAGRVPRTARTIQISKHAPTRIRKLGSRATRLG